jgi:hypothetical protein
MKWLNKLLGRKDYSSILSGFGIDKLSAQRRKVLRTVFMGSLIFHVGIGVIFGSYKFAQALLPEKTVFETPKVTKTYEPRKLEFKVKVQQQQRSSSRPSMMPRMVSTKLSNIALPEIKMDPKVIKTSFQPKFKAVTGAGLGAGLGTGYGIGGFGTGVSAFDFFGIKGRGDRIVILVDVSISMVEDERGGERGYQRVKDRIGKVVDALSAGAIFNIVVFADAASTFEKEMVVANEDYKTKAKSFLRSFNTGGSYGLTSGNVESSNLGLPAVGGTTRLDLALTAAFEQGADTILIISDGLPQVKKGHTAAQISGHRDSIANWNKKHEGAIQQWEASMANYTPQVSEEKVWIPDQPAIPARPPSKGALKEGQAIDRGSPGRPAIPGHWEVRRQVSNPHPPRPAPPPLPDPGMWNLADFVQHFKILHESLYVKKGKKLPIVHAIGYSIDKEGGSFLKALTETYHGRYRRVTKID